MQIETLTASGYGLLHAARSLIEESRDSLLCVAFAHERGVRLLGKELADAQHNGGQACLLVTNVFDRGGSTSNALLAAREFGVEVRIHNHSGRTIRARMDVQSGVGLAQVYR